MREGLGQYCFLGDEEVPSSCVLFYSDCIEEWRRPLHINTYIPGRSMVRRENEVIEKMEMDHEYKTTTLHQHHVCPANVFRALCTLASVGMYSYLASQLGNWHTVEGALASRARESVGMHQLLAIYSRPGLWLGGRVKKAVKG